MNSKMYYYHKVSEVMEQVEEVKQLFLKEFGDIRLDDTNYFPVRLANIFKCNSDEFSTVKDLFINTWKVHRLKGFGKVCFIKLEESINDLADFEILKF